MTKIIDGKRYNTETATLIGEWTNGAYRGDFNRVEYHGAMRMPAGPRVLKSISEAARLGNVGEFTGRSAYD